MVTNEWPPRNRREEFLVELDSAIASPVGLGFEPEPGHGREVLCVLVRGLIVELCG